MPFEINQDAARLHASRSHVLNAERGHLAVPAFGRRPYLDSCAISVIIDELCHAVSVGIEHLADMSKAVPLGRILRTEENRIIRASVTIIRALSAERIIEELLPVALRG